MSLVPKQEQNKKNPLCQAQSTKTYFLLTNKTSMLAGNTGIERNRET